MSRGSLRSRKTAASSASVSPRLARADLQRLHLLLVVELLQLPDVGRQQARSQIGQSEPDRRRRWPACNDEPTAHVLHQRIQTENRRVPVRVPRNPIERIEAHSGQRLAALEPAGIGGVAQIEVGGRRAAVTGGGADGLQQMSLARTGAPPQPEHAWRTASRCRERCDSRSVRSGDERIEAGPVPQAHPQSELFHVRFQRAAAARPRLTAAARRV